MLFATDLGLNQVFDGGESATFRAQVANADARRITCLLSSNSFRVEALLQVARNYVAGHSTDILAELIRDVRFG